jgi:hypothetical protein
LLHLEGGLLPAPQLQRALDLQYEQAVPHRALSEDAAPLLGRGMAAALAGSWRKDPPVPDPTLEIAPLVQGLLEAGAGGLAWWKLSRAEQDETPPTPAFRDIFRYQVARFRLSEGYLVDAIQALKEHRVEPILGKGWAVASAYARPGLRPVGDLDLYVRDADFDRARAAVASIGSPVDLHRGCPEVDPSFEEVFDRAVIRPCGELPVRCFGPADHLRLVIRHLLRHGAWRSLWLCDVAALIEFEGIDWSRVLAGPDPVTSWMAAIVRLARDLLGAHIADAAPKSLRSGPAPEWLATAILGAWGQPFTPHGRRVPIGDPLEGPSDLARRLRERWPNAIEAAMEMGLSADAAPSSGLKLRATLRRASRYIRKRS